MGLALPDEARAALAEAIEAARASIPQARWVPPENLHVTLAFIGPVDDPMAYREAIGSLDASAGTARLSRAGAFPNHRRARVLWAGLDDDGSVAAVAEAVWEALEPLGFQREERPFSAHVTLARLRAPVGVDLGALTVAPVPVPVTDVVLYASHLGRPAPRYEALERVALRRS